MKKHITILLLLTIVLTHAQSKTRFGLKGGFNISKVTVTDAKISGKISSKLGFNAGMFLAFPISKKVEIHPELLFSNQGYIFKGTEDNITYKQKANINYIAVPVMICFYPSKKFSVEFGPQVSFLLSNKVDVDYTIVSLEDGSISQGSVTIDNKDVTQSIEVGFNFGLGYRITQNIIASGRYNFGLSQANKKSENDKEQDRNSVFQFSLGYLFN